MDVYVNNVVRRGQYHDLFYMDAQIGQYYMDYVQALVNQYRNSTTVFSWELANEVRLSTQSPTSEQ